MRFITAIIIWLAITTGVTAGLSSINKNNIDFEEMLNLLDVWSRNLDV